MLLLGKALARRRTNRADDDAAGDALAGMAVGLAYIVIAFRCHDERGAVFVENRFLAVAEREGGGQERRLQHAIRAGISVRQIAGMHSAFRVKAMELWLR